MLNRMQLKQEAKQITKTARVSAYLFTLVYLAITTVLDAVNTYASGEVVAVMQENFPGMVVPEFFQRALSLPPITVAFIAVMVSLIGAVLFAGNVLYHQGVRNGYEMPFGTLFDGFAFAGKVIWLNIVMGILIFLWSCLFVFPGIIASYRYRFALYNLCENPEMGVMEALRMSKVQTNGYKMELFMLDLSFLGWSILCSLTAGILAIWVSPWMTQTDIGYFEEIKRIKGVGRVYNGGAQEQDDFHRDERF